MGLGRGQARVRMRRVDQAQLVVAAMYGGCCRLSSGHALVGKELAPQVQAGAHPAAWIQLYTLQLSPSLPMPSGV